ncbi:MAG TPA: S8 family serine peptidase [Gammaproteobacteria bacterium]|nr:S8 family serine peptidase [Gammaproteobacteria bacterium]
MRTLPVLVLLAASLAACAQTPERPERTARQARPAPAAPARILLTVAERGPAGLALTGAPEGRYLRRRAYGPTPGVDRILDALAREHGLKRIEGWPIRSLDVYCEVFEVGDASKVDAVLEELKADDRVQLAQRMNTFETLTGRAEERADDPYADLQPAALQLDLPEAHRVATGKGVLVAVIDSAVDTKHPDLAGRVRLERDFVDGHGSPKRGEVHGTAVAGIIGSLMDNREGIVGVAPDVDIAALRACWPVDEHESGARCSSFSLAQALEVAIEIRAAVINLSLTGPRDPLLESLLDQAQRRGAVVVAAQPEAGTRQDSFPASHPRVIVVRGSAAAGDPASPYLLSAPADEILTTVPDRGYAFLSGTSLAAAHVSGVVALLMERAPGLRVDVLAPLLRSATVRSSAGTSVNACLALEKVVMDRFCSERGASVETASSKL